MLLVINLFDFFTFDQLLLVFLFESVGKTLSYAVPIIEKLHSHQPKVDRSQGPYCFVIVPTREVLLRTLFLVLYCSMVCCNCNCKYDNLYSTVSSKLLLGCFTRLLIIKTKCQISKDKS